MSACEPRKPRETSVRFRETGDGTVWVSVVVSRNGDRTRALLKETQCRDMGDAVERALNVVDLPDSQLNALPYAHG